MADHLFDPRILRRLGREPLAPGEVILACDPEIHRLFDLDEATRVWLEGERIAAIGKKLAPYNAIDSGLFLATPDFFAVLEELRRESGDASLSEGMRRLAGRGLARALLLRPEEDWHDVDTPAARREGERRLLQRLRKESDGFVSRHWNRPLSLWLTSHLCRTPITPNQVTMANTALGLLAAYFASRGGYLWMAGGAFLFQLASVTDGVDGELARLNGSGSRRGEWYDTMSDLATYFLFPFGLAAGLLRGGAGPATRLALGLAAAGMIASLAIILPAVRRRQSGSLLTFRAELARGGRTPRLLRWVSAAQFMVRRDFYSFLFFVLGVLGLFPAILWLYALGANLIWIAALALRPPAHGAPLPLAATEPLAPEEPKR